MSPCAGSPQDEKYVAIITGPLRLCRGYKPKFGHGTGLALSEFRTLYQADPFYSWFGLDSPLLYAAHRAAGGMTSVYRQIGIGCERLVQQVLVDSLGLTVEEASWSYQATKGGGQKQILSLDCRIPVESVRHGRRSAVTEWLRAACSAANVSTDVAAVLKGAVFEVRQGYKSKDSKRQNADIANAGAAYSEGYLPVLLLLSTQIDDDIAERYRNVRWLILRGDLAGAPTNSTYDFFRRVVGYDLAGFFHRHSSTFKKQVESVLRTLLK